MFNLNKKNKIGTNPSPTDEKPEFPKRESQLPLPKNKIPMPECKQYSKYNNILEKKIRFNNKNWLIKINGNEFEVFLYDDNGEIDRNYLFRGWESGKTLIDQCRNIMLKANKCLFPIDELDDFQKWDGNMDEELNIR